jgi:hypothetical protein
MFFTLPANLYPENSFNSCSIVTYNGAELGAIAGSLPIILPKNKCVLLCNDLATTLTFKLSYFQSDELTADVVLNLKGNTNYKLFLPYPVLKFQNEAGVPGGDNTNLLTIFCFN